MPQQKRQAAKSDVAYAAMKAIRDGDAGKLQEMLASGLHADQTAQVEGIQMQGMEAFGSTGKMRCPLLYLAAQCNSYPCAKALLDHGADPNASFTDPTTGMACVPLQACFDAQRKLRMPCALDIAAELIAAKADANTAGRTPDGCTELMICCEVGDAAATRFLLDHRADPNLGKHNGSSPLFKAAQAGHDLCVDLLIAARADLDKPFASGCTSLGMAAAQGHAHIVSLLLNAGADAHVVAHADNSTALSLAKQGRHQSCVQLLQAKAQLPPHPAHAPGARVVVRGVIARPELNGQRGSVYRFDGLSGRYNIALYDGGSVALKPANLAPLTDPPADELKIAPAATAAMPVSLEELNALLMTKGVTHRLEALLRRDDVDPNGQIASEGADEGGSGSQSLGFGAWTTLLARASLLMLQLPGKRPVGQPQLLRALLSGGASANAPTASGARPLHVSAKLGQLPNLKLLLEHGADVNAACEKGTTALHQAVMDSGVPASSVVLILKTILGTGKVANIDARDTAGFSAFATAVEHGASAGALQFLLEHGADVNLEVTPGFNPLAVACCSAMSPPSREVTRLLLAAKADVTTSWADPTSRNPTKRSTREWASLRPQSAFSIELASTLDFDHEAEEARRLGHADEAAIDRLTDALAAGKLSEADAAKSLRAATAAKCRSDLEEENRARVATSIRFAEATRGITAVGSGAAATGVPVPVPEPTPEEALPRGSEPVHGGRVEVQGLQGAAEHNGKRGHVVSWNADGKRRFGVRLDAGGKMLNVKPRNLLPVDSIEWLPDFPPDFDPRAFCASLQDELSLRGLGLTVLDWTPLASTIADVVHLVHMAHGLVGVSTVVFVQRTAATTPFFLAHRELILGKLFGPSSDAPTLPWALFGDNLTAMPPQWQHSCQPDFIARLCLHCAAPMQQCSICLEEKPTAGSPGQLPCVHFICSSCLPKAFTPVTRMEYARIKSTRMAERRIPGLKCPVCRCHFKGYVVVPSEGDRFSGPDVKFSLVEFQVQDAHA